MRALSWLVLVVGCNSSELGTGCTPLVPEKLPIDHIVVVVKENHTFDNYFGSFPGAEGTTTCQLKNGTMPCPHAPDSTSRDLCHEHSCALSAWGHGMMNGWEDVRG